VFWLAFFFITASAAYNLLSLLVHQYLQVFHGNVMLNINKSTWIEYGRGEARRSS